MSILRNYLPYLCFLSGSIFLLRGIKLLLASATAARTTIPDSAYEHGYAFGQVAVSILFIVAAAGFLLFGWRRLQGQRNQ
jgi:uncharacterized membrane protein